MAPGIPWTCTPRCGLIVAFGLHAALSGDAAAATIRVPLDAASIGSALGIAQAGDTVLVSCGTYFEHDLTVPSGVVLRSETGQPDCVTIDAQQGGRVLHCPSSSTATLIEGLTLTGGYTTGSGGGAYVAWEARPTFRRCVIAGNEAHHGGGILGFAPTLEFCTITSNHSSGFGGAMYIQSGVTATDCTISGNSSEGLGGAAYLWGAGSRWTRCTFAGNTAGGAGGALHQTSSGLRLTNCVFEHNSAGYPDLSQPGGAVWVERSSVHLIDCTFRENAASEGGACKLVDADVAELLRCAFVRNVAHDGGGLSIRDCLPTVEACTFLGNSVSEKPGIWGGLGRGGGILVSQGTPPLVVLQIGGCTFASNAAEEGGGLAFFALGQARVERSIFTHQIGGAFAHTDPGASIVASCCDSYANDGGNWTPAMIELPAKDSFSADPLYCDLSADDLRVRANSLCTASLSPCGTLVGVGLATCEARGVYVATSSSGLLVYGDGVANVSDAFFDWSPGTKHEVAVPDSQDVGEGFRYRFRSWSDGGERVHSVQVQSTLDRFVADHDSLFFLETVVEQGQGSVSPPASWRPSHEVVQIEAVADSGWAFVGWIGEGAGSYTGNNASAQVTMARPIRQRARFARGTPITLLSEPSGLAVWIDAQPYVTPATVVLVSGYSYSISTDSLQVVEPGHRKRFLSWSNGLGREQPLSVGLEPVTLTASFATDYELTLAATDQGQLFPGNTWSEQGSEVVIRAQGSFGFTFSSWVGTGSGSYTGISNPAIVTLNGPVLEEAVFTSTLPGQGYDFTISASATSPLVSDATPTGTARSLYLWMTCSDLGISAFETGVSGSLPVLGFEPMPYVLNAGGPTNLLLALGGCPSGVNVNLLLGAWTVWDTGGTMCLSPSSTGVVGAVDCHPIDPAFWPNPHVIGFASDGSEPCEVGANGCVPDSVGPISVDLTQLKAVVVERHVELSWSTSFEHRHDGFRVYRARQSVGDVVCVTPELIQGTSPYLYVDGDVESDRNYYYRVGAVDLSGSEQIFGPVTVQTPRWVPLVTGLLACRPNPFSDEASLEYSLASPGRVRISVYDVMGRMVQRLVDAQLDPGSHVATWRGRAPNGERVASGIYFARMEVGTASWSKKLVVLGRR